VAADWVASSRAAGSGSGSEVGSPESKRASRSRAPAVGTGSNSARVRAARHCSGETPGGGVLERLVATKGGVRVCFAMSSA